MRHCIIVTADAEATSRSHPFRTLRTWCLASSPLLSLLRSAMLLRITSTCSSAASLQTHRLRAMRCSAPGLSSSAARLQTLSSIHSCVMAHSRSAATACMCSLSATAQVPNRTSKSVLPRRPRSSCSDPNRCVANYSVATPLPIRILARRGRTLTMSSTRLHTKCSARCMSTAASNLSAHFRSAVAWRMAPACASRSLGLKLSDSALKLVPG